MEKMPSFETKKPARFRTIERIVKETLPSGKNIEEVVECNGTHHRQCVDKITYSSDGEIDFVDQLSREDLGECDGNHS